MAASVPEETSRTCSIDGTASMISSASSTSAAVQAPNLVPRLRPPEPLPPSRIGVAEEQRPPGLHPVHLTPPVLGLEVGA